MTQADDVCRFESDLRSWMASAGILNFTTSALVGDVSSLASEMASIEADVAAPRVHIQHAFIKLVDQFEKHARERSSGGNGIPFALTPTERSTCVSLLFYLLAVDLRDHATGRRAELIATVLRPDGT